MKKLSLEALLIPLFVSFFMSGINAMLRQLDTDIIVFSSLFSQWMINWMIAYPCLLILVPFSRKIVLKLFERQLKQAPK